MAPKIIDLTGKKYGLLTVIKRLKKRGTGAPYWLCKCECGKETVISGLNLRHKLQWSCGCRGLIQAKKRTMNKDLDQIAGVKLFNGQMSAEDFKRVRMSLGFTIQRLADEMCVSKSLVDDYCGGRRVVRPYMQKLLLFICKEYGMEF